MNEHLEQHVKHEPWECLWSGCSAMVEKKRWMYRSSLLQHMSSHVPDYRPVGCPFCDFRAAFQWRMAAHIRRKHADCRVSTTGTAPSPTASASGTSSSSTSGSTPTTAVPLLFDGMPLSSLLSGPLTITTLPGDDSTPVFIRPATPPPQPPQPPQPPRLPLLPRIAALDQKRGTPPPAARPGVVRAREADCPVVVHVKSNVDALPAVFQMTLPPALTVAQFLAGMHDRYRACTPGQTAFHLSLARAPFGNVRHHVSIPLCKYETPVVQLLQPDDHLMLCAVAPQE